MKFRSRHLLILLGTLGSVCLSSRLATATEVQTTEATLTAEANTPSPTVAPSASEAPSPASASPPQTAPSTPVEASPATPPSNQAPAPQSSEGSLNLPLDAPEPRAQNFTPLDSPDTPVASKPRVPATRPNSPLPIAPAEPSQSSRIARDMAPASSEPYASATEVSEANPAEAPIVIAQASPADEPRSATKADQKQETKKLNSGKLGQLTFVCGTEKGEPATIAKLNDRNIGVILWNSTLFTAKGFDPKTRCQQVSARFQEYNKAKNLVYLTTGNINGQSVICVSTKEGGGCGDVSPYEGLLFTLKPSSNAEDTLEQLSNVLAVKDGTATEPLKE